MENKGKINKGKIKAFRKSNGTKHFTPATSPVSDVLGSYTGIPMINNNPEDTADVYPTQDADDL